MSKPEIDIQNEIRIALADAGTMNWRNNTGALKDRDGRLVRYGLCPGSSDIIGIKKIKITEDMVGQEIGRFVAIEVKTLKGKASEDQEKFLHLVRKHGGLAGVARSEEEALAVIASRS
ncbi:MAG: VRR-NUC domain-containing protein [Planctomycetes bacterium]|nr:VRR-NUC domain-containing protein [Planctomycetota bacterium]